MSIQRRSQLQQQNFDSQHEVLPLQSSAGKLWTERMVLAQSPIWITAVGMVMVSGVLRHWRDAEYLLFSAVVASPTILWPAFSRSRPDRNRPWSECYWFKLNLWVAIVVFFGTYIGTHYFFDLMGMRYTFEVRWFLNSDVIGQNRQLVPLFMYPLTHAYFMSYYVVLMVADRFIVKRLGLGAGGAFFVVMLLAYSLAYVETYFMAADFFSDLFQYDNRDRMLTVGSFGYASYFVVGLPVVRRMDARGELWSLQRVVIEALATCMAILLLLEVWAKVVGPLG
jgi:cycloeucalenol cycloisomerase